MTRTLGALACIVGLCGVVAAAVGYHVLTHRRSEGTPGWTVETTLTKKWNFRFGTVPAEAPLPPQAAAAERAKLVAAWMGIAAISLAVFSWIRREGIALGVMACFLGVAAMAWEQAIIIFMALILIGGPALWFYWPWSEARKQ